MSDAAGQALKSHLLRERVLEIIKNALGYRRSNWWWANSVTVKLAPPSVALHIEYCSIGSQADTELVRESLSSARGQILAAAGEAFSSFHISLSDGRQASRASFEQWASESACSDDDDHNPNWPSKTGQPSGGGRGNNPPRR